MSFYDNSQPWSAGPGQTPRQSSWEQPPPPSRSGTSSTGARENEPNAFLYQLAEVERAIDNLVKSGKMPFAAGMSPSFGGPGMMHRHPSMGSDFDVRPHSNSGLQNFYQNQRYGPRNEQDQMQAAKRRMAAQRERELRNYHQEQQYAKNVSGPKSDRSMSPNKGMSEDERRELIARQHRALYGSESSLYTGGEQGSQDARERGGSPLAYGMQARGGQGEPAVQMPPREQQQASAGAQSSDRKSSPSANQNPTFNNFDNSQQQGRTSTSSPTGGSPPGGSHKQQGGIAPIGTRSSGNQAPVQGLQKRSTTPLPSPLSYGFSAQDQEANERSNSASSNPQEKPNHVGSSIGWGSNSGVWGNPKSGLGVQAPVWG